jgi:TonB family protein
VWIHLLLLVAVRCQELPAGVLDHPETVLRPVTLEIEARDQAYAADRDPRSADAGEPVEPEAVAASSVDADPVVEVAETDASAAPAVVDSGDDTSGSARVAEREAPTPVEPAPATPIERVALDVERQETPPEPDEPEPDEEEDLDMLRFVRVDEPAVTVEPPEDAEYISARDAAHELRTRAPVTEPDPGPRTPHGIGLSELASRPALLAAEGDPSDPTGKKPEVSEEVARSASEESGGGRNALDMGAGAPERGGDRRQGGAAAPQSGRSRASLGHASAGTVAPAPVDGFREGPEPDAVVDVDAPEWWNPMATRPVASSAPPPAPTPEERVASPSEGDAVALVLSPGESSDRGGTASDADEAALPTEAEEPTVSTGRQERAGAADPIEDLREALGWGGIDRSALRPPQAVVDEEYDLARVSWVDATETPLGRYTDRVHEAIDTLWRAQDLEPDERARGIQGNVTIEFKVFRNGRVSNLELVKSSGHPGLDLIALRSVPRRLPRIPREVGVRSVLQRITFHYRNPLITADSYVQ